MNILIGIFLIAIGLITIKYNRQVSQALGTPSFLWKYFGPGREYTLYILVSVVIIILGFFVLFGLFGIITNAIFAPFRGLVR